MKNRRNPFPGLTRVKDRHGKTRWRYRKGAYSTYIHGAYNSAEFRAEYEAAVAEGGVKVKASRNAFGSVSWLVEQYVGSLRFRDLSPIRQKNLLNSLDWLRSQAGELPYARLEARHVELLMARKKGPAAANTVRKTISLLFTFAIQKLGHKGENPAKLAETRKVKSDGFAIWTDEEIDRFLERHGPGTKARFCLLLALNTGMARQDIAAAGWHLVRDGRIAYRRGKTGGMADLPIMPELAEELARIPKDQRWFLMRDDGSGLPYSVVGLGNWFRARADEGGVSGSIHGLRKAGATRLAHAGASLKEIAAYLGHTGTGLVDVYTRKVDRAMLADSAFQKLSNHLVQRANNQLKDN